MAYEVNNSRGQIVAIIPDGTANITATSITLVGKSYASYGEPIAENFVYMLENFAKNTPPDNAIVGQLWWDIANNALKSYTGTAWTPVSGITVDSVAPESGVVVGNLWFDTNAQRLKVYTDLGSSTYAWIDINAIAALASAPSSAAEGELYLNTTTNQLFVYSDDNWLLVGPENVAGFAETKWTSTSIPDTLNVQQPVIIGTVDGSTIAIVANDNFTIYPTARPVGFVSLIRGINMAGDAGIAGYFIGNLAGNVAGTATNVTGVVSSNNGGTGFNSYSRGQILIGSAAGNLSRANITGTDNISVVPSGTNNDLIISYTGGTGVGNVTSVGITAGAGISVSGSPITTNGNITVTNTGVISVIPGAGMTVNQNGSNVTVATNIDGSGPISVDLGENNLLRISYTGGTGVGNVTSVGITAGTGISVLGSPITTNGNITVNNTGVTSIAAGAGITVSQSSGAVTIGRTIDIPSGVIVMWAGAVNNIPVGWAFCDGTNGTPDLRNRFIIAGGGAVNPNTTGGSSFLSLTTSFAGEHDHGGSTASHTLTINEMPNHNHSINNAVGSAQVTSGTTNHQAFNTAQKITETGYTGGGQGHSHQILSTNTAHTHTVNGQYIPPYYALAYIMKL